MTSNFLGIIFNFPTWFQQSASSVLHIWFQENLKSQSWSFKSDFYIDCVWGRTNLVEFSKSIWMLETTVTLLSPSDLSSASYRHLSLIFIELFSEKTCIILYFIYWPCRCVRKRSGSKNKGSKSDVCWTWAAKVAWLKPSPVDPEDGTTWVLLTDQWRNDW